MNSCTLWTADWMSEYTVAPGQPVTPRPRPEVDPWLQDNGFMGKPRQTEPDPFNKLVDGKMPPEFQRK